MGPMQWIWWNAMPRAPGKGRGGSPRPEAVFNSSKRTVITSFKSQIGHTLGASGMNSLIRGVTP